MDMCHPRLCANEDTFPSSGRSTARAGTRRHLRAARPHSEKLVEAINRLEKKIRAFESQMVDRKAEKKVTLSTI
jgi:hypothetical protein